MSNHSAGQYSSTATPWYRELNSYHWYVLVVAALGWLFDTMDQQLFVLSRTPALKELLRQEPPQADPKHSGGSAVDDELTKERTARAEAERKRYGDYATAIFLAGWATGGLVFGLFGDRWGRARTMMLTILIYSLFTGLSAFSVSFWDFAAYRFVTGMGVGGEFAAGVSLVAEVMPARARPYALGLLQALSAVGNMTAAGISFLIPPQMEMQGVSGWRLMFLIGIVPALLVVFIRRRLKEPESWVKAKQALAGGEKGDQLHRQLGDLKELFGDGRWRYNTIVGVSLATSGVLGLWGVGFWMPELVRNNVLRDLPKADQDFYASMALLLQNFGAFFGIYVFSLMSGVTGRRPAFVVALILAWTSTIAVFGFMTDRSQIWWMPPLLGFCSLMVFGGYAIYFPELYPTRLRATGTGFCYNVARYLTAILLFVGGYLPRLFAAPQGGERAVQGLSELTLLSSLGSVDSPFRYAALTIASIYLLGLLVLPFAPETKDRPLPE